MGSYPTYDPSFYTQPHTKAQYDAFGNRPGDPLVDRADQGGYPTGSAFKPITATAALEDGLITPSTIFDDTGSLDIGGLVVHNAGGAANGPDRHEHRAQGLLGRLLLQPRAARQRERQRRPDPGLGAQVRPGPEAAASTSRTPSSGLIPTPAWRNRVYRSHKNPYIDRPWNQGDNVNLAVGQGDVMVTPLQLARAYAALANGGTLVRPHLGGRIVNVHGKTVERIKPPPKRHLRISDETRNVILGGMERAAMEPGGTSYSVMGGLPVPGRRQDRHRASAGRPAGPVLVQRDRAVQQPADRGDGDRRARRLRSRVGGADRTRDPRALLQPERGRRERHGRGIGGGVE